MPLFPKKRIKAAPPSPYIFIGPGEIAGYYDNLMQGFHAVDAKCDFILFSSHKFTYNTARTTSILVHLIQICKQKQRLCKRYQLKRRLLSLGVSVLRRLYFIKALVTYDVFIFSYGNSLLRNNADLPWLRLFRKTIIMNLGHGSEARPPYLDGYNQPGIGEHSSSSKLARQSQSTVRKIRCIEKWADVIIGMPLSTSQFAKRPFINWFCLGIPYAGEISAASIGKSDEERRPVRILHCPSHPLAKGSDCIRTAIAALKKKGILIEYIEITGRPNAEVIAAIQKCDLVVDQLYSDTPMAGLATEAAWFGRPTVVGGYGFQLLADYIPADMWPPSYTCSPDNIAHAVEQLATNRDLRRRTGEAAACFVRERWAAPEVARRYLKLIEGNVPSEWWVDPRKIIYCLGACQHEKVTRENIESLVRTCGSSALQVDHNPDLKQALLEFAGVNLSK